MKSLTRRSRTVIAALVITAIPMVALAADDAFTDVPTTLNSHDAIYNIYDAGLTSGDTATTYAPTKNVNRGQMASFLNRGLGRIAYSGNGTDVALDVTASELGSVTITPGGVVDGATNFVKADASFTVSCADACSVDVSISDGTSSSRVVTVELAAAGSQSGAITWATTASVTNPATAATLTLSATASSGTASAAGELTAIYAPFGADGQNTLDAAP